MRLGNVDMLLLLWLAPVLVALYLLAARRRAAAMRVFVEAGLVGRISTSVNPGARRIKAALVVAGVAFIALALARPAWNPRPRTIERRGRDVVVVLDVSRSMLAEDLVPNRLERAKLALADMLERLEGDRVALVAFAGSAVLKCPLTLDYGFFRMALEDVDVGSVARGGTMIGDAIRKALDEAFDDQEKKYKDIILITDGEDHDSFPVEAAEEAGRRGVRIIAVGIGDEDQGRRIPVTDADGRRAFLTYQGREIWSRLDAATLRAMAHATPGGRYLNVATGTIDLGEVYADLIAGEEKREIESQTITLYEEKFQIFIAAALVLLALEMLVSERRRGERTEAIASRTRRGVLVILAAAAQLAAALCAASLPASAAAESPARLVRRGNSSFREGDFARAREYYDLASVRMPESPVVEFNLGAVLYMQDDYAGARERFEEAALRVRDLSLEALAWYNSGNCAFRQAERQADGDPEAALKHLEESVAFYTTALDKDPGLEDAAYNLEIARLMIRDLLDRIKQMQERMEEQRERLAAIVDSLAAALGRQREALAASRDLAAAPDRGAEPWRGRLGSATRGQRGVSETTGAAAAALDDLFPGERPAPAEQALAHLDSALVAQHEAREALAGGAPEAAAPRQERSAEGIRAAIEALTEGGGQRGEGEQRQDQAQQGDRDESPEERERRDEPREEDAREGETPPEQQQVPQEPRSETARGIIDEERENRRKRREQAPEGYRRVERDW